MTILMTFVGTIVFIFSMFTVGFKSAFKRMWMFALTGLAIDLFIVTTSVVVSYAVTSF